MNVVFLDYDGVVNTPIWDNKGQKCSFSYPENDKVNNFQAVQWVSEFCQKLDYKIVVTSTWRKWNNYKDCLINGGLRDGIEILGKTITTFDKSRGFEIKDYLSKHPEIENFLIFDDEDDMDDLMEHLVLCRSNVGFTLDEYTIAKVLHEKFSK